MSVNSTVSDQASFLKTRDPSIWGWDQRVRFADPARKQLFNEILEEESCNSEKSGISTYLRLKPSATSTDQVTLSILNETTVVTKPPKESITFKNKISGRVLHQYTFSKVLGPDTSQKELFEECVAYQVKDFILGSNCLLFAYGTTNAGKTYTIQGSGSSPGVIPRSLDLLFKSIRDQVAGVGRYKPDKVEGIVQLDSSTMAQELDYKNRILQWNWDKPLEPIKSGTHTSNSNISGCSESDFISSTYREMQKTLSNDSPIDMSSEADVVYGVWVSFAEVYNECVFDLLDPILSRNRKRIPLKMAQDNEGNTFIRDLKMIHVSSGDEAFHVMLYGKANLQVAATNMNSHSSRSHCIFTIRLVRYANSDNPSYAIVSSFTFCDLAGAERAKKTLNAGDRLKESNNINTSLHVLGRCLATIRENQKRNEKRPVPFRDSKLTRIFQRALTGHERITMIVNASTAPVLFDETVNVLKFSAVAKQIVLETPIKKPKPAVKKSRFSIMVSRPNPHGTICWDAPTEDDSTLSSRVGSEVGVQKYNAQNEELLSLVERLKEQLAEERRKNAEEREKNLTLERKVRQSVTETFSKIIHDMENSWKARLRDIEERNENLSSWRITQLENYYKQQLEGSRKRRRESEIDDSIVLCDSPAKDKRVEELEEEIQVLQKECSAVHQLLKEAQDIQASISADNSSLKFEIANANAELEKCRRQLLASEKQADGVPDAFTKEIQQQLVEEKQKVTELIKKNENLRELLDEAKQEFLLLNQEKDEADSEATKFQNELVEKLDELAEITQQLEATQLLLTQKSRALDSMEEKYDSLAKAHETCEKDLKEISLGLKEHEEAMQTVEELQAQLRSLAVSDESEGALKSTSTSDTEAAKSLLTLTQSLSETVKMKLSEFRKVKADFDSLRSCVAESLVTSKQKEEEESNLREQVLQLQQQLEKLQSSKLNDTEQNEASLLKTIAEKEDTISSLQSEKHSQYGEIKRLEKDLKETLQKNMRVEQQLKEVQSELESSNNNSSRLEQELKSVLQRSLNLSASSQVELETIGLKGRTYEETLKLFRDWKEEASKTIEQLKSELKASQEANERRGEELKSKDTEVSNIHAHRTELINRYEEALKRTQEELEREKREVIRLRDALYKSTPTPKKNESAEIRHLKELVESLQCELSLRRADEQLSAKKLTKSNRKVNKQESISSNESLKENIGESFSVSSSTSKSKRTANIDVKEYSASESKLNVMKEPSLPHPASSQRDPEDKPKRKGRRLFTRHQSQSVENDDDDVEAVEVESLRATTPDTYVKRSLRNRKV